MICPMYFHEFCQAVLEQIQTLQATVDGLRATCDAAVIRQLDLDERLERR
jgi:hypothetical protein